MEHIIPQSRLFDDSFSNKTLIPGQINLDNANKTAYDYVFDAFEEDKLDEFVQRVDSLFNQKEGGIYKAKYLLYFKKVNY